MPTSLGIAAACEKGGTVRVKRGPTLARRFLSQPRGESKEKHAASAEGGGERGVSGNAANHLPGRGCRFKVMSGRCRSAAPSALERPVRRWGRSSIG